MSNVLSDLEMEMLTALKNFVNETRAYSSPECDESEITGPLLREADAIIAKAEARLSSYLIRVYWDKQDKVVELKGFKFPDKDKAREYGERVGVLMFPEAVAAGEVKVWVAFDG